MSTSESCDCTTEESDDNKKDLSCKENTKNEESVKPFEFIQLKITKAQLNLIPSSTDESSSSCDQDSSKKVEAVICNCHIVEKDSSKTCSSDDNKDSLVSCDCTTEETLKSCTCSSCSDDSLTSLDSLAPKILEHTLAIIKPEAMMYRKEIEKEIIDEGFQILQRRWLRLTPEQVTEFYRDNYKKQYFANLVTYMSSDPIMVFVLARYNAIKEWKFLMGPKKVMKARAYTPDSIRGKYGRKGDDMQNAVHGSENQEAAEREIGFFFPDRIKQPLLSEEDAVEYLKKYVNEPLTEALIKCCEEKPDDPVIWLGNWLLENNPNKPKYLLRYKSNLYD